MSKKTFLFIITIINLHFYCGPIYSSDFSSESSIDLILEAENTAEISKEQKIKYYLPQEIIPEYLEENSGFSIEMDPEKNQFYLHKSVVFEPGEIRHFHFQVKNVWIMPKIELSGYFEEAKALRKTFAGKNLESDAESLFNSVKNRYDEIISTYGKAESVKAHIEQFRINEKKFKEIISLVNKMRNLQSLTRRDKIDLKITKGKIRNIMMLLIIFISIIAVLSWKVWKEKK